MSSSENQLQQEKTRRDIKALVGGLDNMKFDVDSSVEGLEAFGIRIRFLDPQILFAEAEKSSSVGKNYESYLLKPKHAVACALYNPTANPYTEFGMLMPGLRYVNLGIIRNALGDKISSKANIQYLSIDSYVSGEMKKELVLSFESLEELNADHRMELHFTYTPSK